MASLVSIIYVAALFAVGQSIKPRGSGELCGCVFGDNCYANYEYIQDACITMVCKNGNWILDGISQNCGICKVEGDPHIYPFEFFLTPSASGNPIASKYLLNKAGEYVITQPGFSSSALFGVNANFEHCDYLEDLDLVGMCIDKATYHEPGIKVTLTLPTGIQAAKCVNGTVSDPVADPKCDIKVSVNGESIGALGNSVLVYNGGFGGPILIFKYTNCVAVVGTKGFSVTLCEHYQNYPYFYIWAWPSLKSTPDTVPASQLHGLCNLLTNEGPTAYNFVLQDKTSVPTQDCLTWTTNAWEICDEFSQSWKLPI